jgi:hypothetical protein
VALEVADATFEQFVGQSSVPRISDRLDPHTKFGVHRDLSRSDSATGDVGGPNGLVAVAVIADNRRHFCLRDHLEIQLCRPRHPSPMRDWAISCVA